MLLLWLVCDCVTGSDGACDGIVCVCACEGIVCVCEGIVCDCVANDGV